MKARRAEGALLKARRAEGALMKPGALETTTDTSL